MHQDREDRIGNSAAAVGTYGTSGKNAFRMPGKYNWDMGLFKNFEFKERWKLQFRGEAFNLLNHPIYGNPAANISSLSTFGRITSVLNSGATGIGTPRRLQFMLRLEF